MKRLMKWGNSDKLGYSNMLRRSNSGLDGGSVVWQKGVDLSDNVFRRIGHCQTDGRRLHISILPWIAYQIANCRNNVGAPFEHYTGSSIADELNGPGLLRHRTGGRVGDYGQTAGHRFKSRQP